MERQILWMSVAAAFTVVAVLIIGFFAKDIGDCRDFNQAKVHTPSTEISVAVAKNSTERTRGLGGCKSIPSYSGMYFPLPDEGRATFWMKGMVIPIDIVWIDNGKVTQVSANIPPASGKKDTELVQYQPDFPVNAVLEVGAGKAQEYGLTPGATIQYIP